MNLDQKIFTLVHSLAGKSQVLDFLAVFLSDYFGYLLFLAGLTIIWYSGNWKERAYYYSFLFLALLLSRGIITETTRFFYHRPRPFMALDFIPLIPEVNQGAFPSGHAAFYFALAGLILMINRRLGWYFAVGAAVMGAARVFVGVHWPGDILGGALVAAASVYIVYLLLARASTQ